MLDTNKTNNDRNELVELYNQRQYEEVVKKLNDSELEKNNDPILLNIIGASYQQIEDLEKARKYFSRSTELNPSYSEALYNLANIEFAEDSYQKAFDKYNEALDNNFTDPIILVQMGRCLMKLGSIDDAMILYENAVEINADCERAYIEMAEVMAMKKEPQAAIDYYYKALDINPNSFICHLRLARYFKNINQPKMAMNFVQKLFEIGFENKELLLEQTELLHTIGLYDEAIFSSKKILEKDNQNSKAFNLIAKSLLELGLVDEAIEALCDAIYLEGEIGEYYCNLGIALSKVGNFQDAEECLHKSIELIDNSPKNHYELGNLYEKTGDYTNSLEQYKIASNLNREYIYPLIGKLSVSRVNTDLNSETLFKEICSHMAEKNIPMSFDPSSITEDHKPIALLSFGKPSGSLYLQSLINAHPEISTIPGYYFKAWFGDKTWGIFNPEMSNPNWRTILTENICHHFEPLFNASSSKAVLGVSNHRNPSAKMMGLNKLGKNQSKVFSLDIELFKKQFLDLLQDLDFIDEKTCFESIHKAFDFAYSPQTQTNSRNKKIVYNFFKPNLYNFIKFVSKFPESKTLYLVQNPIQLLESFINEGFKNIKGQEVKKDIKILSKICNEIIQTLVNSNHPLNKICNTQGIKLEDVINSPKKILPKIAKWMNINDLPEMYDSKFLDHQFLNQSKKEALLNLSNDKKETKPINNLFGTRDKKIIETLLWPMMSAFKYTTLKENQFKKNMTEIRPWLDEPFQFEQRYYTKITNKTKSLKDMDSYKALHKHLIKHWEILNQNNKHHNVVSQIIQ